MIKKINIKIIISFILTTIFIIILFGKSVGVFSMIRFIIKENYTTPFNIIQAYTGKDQTLSKIIFILLFTLYIVFNIL